MIMYSIVRDQPPFEVGMLVALSFLFLSVDAGSSDVSVFLMFGCCFVVLVCFWSRFDCDSKRVFLGTLRATPHCRQMWKVNIGCLC